MTTRWDQMPEELRTRLTLKFIGVNCTGCNAYLNTEADFAAHFVILTTSPGDGECPETEQGRELLREEAAIQAHADLMEQREIAYRAGQAGGPP